MSSRHTITNQLSAGVSYFNQVFSDANTDLRPDWIGPEHRRDRSDSRPALLTFSSAPPAPASALPPAAAASDPLGVTAPSGRNDITGHLDEDLTWTKGAHRSIFGGEYRHAQVDDFYQTGQRGTIYFDGTQGPWCYRQHACGALATTNLQYVGAPPSSLPTDPNAYFLADFLAGCFDPSTTESSSEIPSVRSL